MYEKKIDSVAPTVKPYLPMESVNVTMPDFELTFNHYFFFKIQMG
jgi:hypothetical protein